MTDVVMVSTTSMPKTQLHVLHAHAQTEDLCLKYVAVTLHPGHVAVGLMLQELSVTLV